MPEATPALRAHPFWRDPGTEMLPFRGLSYAQNLARCQRYIRVFGGPEWAYSNAFIGTAGDWYSTTHMDFSLPLNPPMRGTPSVTINAASNFIVRGGASGNLDPTGVVSFARAHVWYSDWQVASGGTAAAAGSLFLDDNSGTGKVILNAANS